MPKSSSKNERTFSLFRKAPFFTRRTKPPKWKYRILPARKGGGALPSPLASATEPAHRFLPAFRKAKKSYCRDALRTRTSAAGLFQSAAQQTPHFPDHGRYRLGHCFDCDHCRHGRWLQGGPAQEHERPGGEHRHPLRRQNGEPKRRAASRKTNTPHLR